MNMTVTELAGAIGAVCQGDGEMVVESCAGLDDAGPTQVSFVANRRYVSKIAESRAGVIVVSASDAESLSGRTLLIADDPYFAFRQAMVTLHGFRQHPQAGVSAQAAVDASAVIGQGTCVQAFVTIEPGAKIGKGCVIYSHCYIGRDAVIGDDCQLYPNVTIYDQCVLGDRVTLHAGCVIGQDGFGYATHALPGEPPRHHKIPQVGNVVIEDDVEMGANCAIDRATIGSTRIGRGTKFSDMVTIGHGTTVGQHNLYVAQVGVAGSTTIGNYVVMGGQAGVAGHLKIADQVQLAGQTGVTGDLNKPGQYGSLPAIEMKRARRSWLAIPRLPEMIGELRTLRKRIGRLEKQIGKDEAGAE